jgi:hypothetical protein
LAQRLLQLVWAQFNVEVVVAVVRDGLAGFAAAGVHAEMMAGTTAATAGVMTTGVEVAAAVVVVVSGL